MQGLLLIDKPEGITSFSAVARIKKICGIKRVGHTGTLDPLATGVLPVFIGRPTVLCDFLLTANKEYIATVKLGETTDTLDRTGKILSKRECDVSLDSLLGVLEDFKGKQKQIPPMYSAIKKDGVRLYDLARKGEEVEREPRDIEIFELELLEKTKNIFKIRVLCSKGTYIRSLVSDIGEKLGTGATLYELRRTKTAGFDIKDCISLEKINSENISFLIKNEELAVNHFKKVSVSKKQGTRFSNGGELDLERLKISESVTDKEIFRVECEGLFIGLGYVDISSKSLKIKCLVRHPSDEI